MMHSENMSYPLKIHGAFSISLHSRVDNRGSMVRIWESQGELEKFELNQASFVANPLPKTLNATQYTAATVMKMLNWKLNSILAV